jgi:hypothetical protein
MTVCKTTTAAVITLAGLGTGLVTAAPASAGGVGDFLSPAFGTSCANQETAPRIDGTTHHETGTASGNLAGLPIGSPLNQCGGADLAPLTTTVESSSVSGLLSQSAEDFLYVKYANALENAVPITLDKALQGTG